MIYLKLQGRIGNQLFMYAAARMVQLLQGNDQEIIIEDCNNLKAGYLTVLDQYDLSNVRFVHDLKTFKSFRMILQRWTYYFIKLFEIRMTPRKRYEFEKKHQKLFNSFGVIRAIDGYIDLPNKFRKDTFMYGFFQSERYFLPIKDEIRRAFSIQEIVDSIDFSDIDKVRNSNTICISIKVQHNAGNPMYDVCTKEYYDKALSIMIERVEDPVFFICSDNVQYVLDNLIDANKYSVVMQDSSIPIHITLALMAQSKHFIIGNTSFGWWAQYLSDNSDKIVVAPSRWYGIDVPCDIYQDNWTLIEV